MTNSTVLLGALQREIAARGWNKKPTGRIVLELIFHLTAVFGGIAIFVFADNILIRLVGMFISTYGSLGIATNAHTASHHAASSKPWINYFLTRLGYPVILGVSEAYWRNKHIVVHHPAPNVIGVDDDADLLPWFAMSPDEAARSSRLRRFYYHKVQWYLFPLALMANGLNVQRAGILFLYRALRDGRRRTRAHWIDLGCMTLYFLFWFALPMLFFSPIKVVEFNLLRVAAIGYAMFAAFAPAHFPAEATRVRKDQKNADYLLLQTSGTVNFKTGFFGRLACAGVDYQIEHHLFPNVSHVYYRQLSPIVQEFCREHGLPYRTLPWGYALWKCWDALRDLQPVHSSLEDLRLPAPEPEMAMSEVVGRS
jgi:linoleoyl-CoA desaturase